MQLFHWRLNKMTANREADNRGFNVAGGGGVKTCHRGQRLKYHLLNFEWVSSWSERPRENSSIALSRAISSSVLASSVAFSSAGASTTGSGGTSSADFAFGSFLSFFAGAFLPINIHLHLWVASSSVAIRVGQYKTWVFWNTLQNSFKTLFYFE